MVKLNAKLDAVSKARQAYVLARTTLEARLREQMRDELTNLQTQVDIAVRYAFDSGESKASIMRAMGTKDYNTMNASLERTRSVSEVKGTDPLDYVYSLNDDVLTVNYVNHGDANITGTAEFEVSNIDGKVFLKSMTSLYNEDYSKRNDVVGWLDGRFDGEYYDEAVRWLSSS
jgi:hypothetical protein